MSNHGFKLVDWACVLLPPITPPTPPKCFCDNGKVKSDCLVGSEHACISCDDGFLLHTSGRCIAEKDITIGVPGFLTGDEIPWLWILLIVLLILLLCCGIIALIRWCLIKCRRRRTPKKVPKPIPAAKIAYVGEVWVFTVIVQDLPKHDNFADDRTDPYFYFYLDNKMYYGGRETTLKDTRTGEWRFPLVASEVRLSTTIKIVWMDYYLDSTTHKKDEEIGVTQVSVAQVTNGLTEGFQTRYRTDSLEISGTSATISIIVEKQPEPSKTINRTNSFKSPDLTVVDLTDSFSETEPLKKI